VDSTLRLLSIFLTLIGITVGMAKVYVDVHGVAANPKMMDEFQRAPASMESLRADRDVRKYRPRGADLPPPPAPLVDPATTRIYVYGRCTSPYGEIFYPDSPNYRSCIDNETPYKGPGPFSSKAIGIGIVISD